MKLGRAVIVAWAWVGGCAPQVGTEGGATDDSSGDASGTPTTTMSTSTTVGTTTAADTSTTTSTTTGQPVGCSGDWVTGCQSQCAALITCHPELGSYEDCVTECVQELAEEAPECQVAWCEAYTCVGLLDCATLDAGSPECEELGFVADSVCGTSGTSDSGDMCYVGGNGEACEYGCEPGGLRFICSKDSCTCFEDGFETAICPAPPAVCDNWDELAGLAMECCGW